MRITLVSWKVIPSAVSFSTLSTLRSRVAHPRAAKGHAQVAGSRMPTSPIDTFRRISGAVGRRDDTSNAFPGRAPSGDRGGLDDRDQVVEDVNVVGATRREAAVADQSTLHGRGIPGQDAEAGAAHCWPRGRP